MHKPDPQKSACKACVRGYTTNAAGTFRIQSSRRGTKYVSSVRSLRAHMWIVAGGYMGRTPSSMHIEEVCQLCFNRGVSFLLDELIESTPGSSKCQKGTVNLDFRSKICSLSTLTINSIIVIDANPDSSRSSQHQKPQQRWFA